MRVLLLVLALATLTFGREDPAEASKSLSHVDEKLLALSLERGIWIVELNETPSSLYHGGMEGYPGVSARSMNARRMDRRSDNVLRYESLMESRSEHVAQVDAQTLLGRELKIHAYFSTLMVGFTTNMKPEEAELLRSSPAVKSVTLAQIFSGDLPLANDSTSDGHHVPLETQDAALASALLTKAQSKVSQARDGALPVLSYDVGDNVANLGEGSVVAIVDGLVNHELLPAGAFDGVSLDGYEFPLPRDGVARAGSCDPTSSFYDPEAFCNNKFLGQYDYFKAMDYYYGYYAYGYVLPINLIPRSEHGTSVAFSAVGNPVPFGPLTLRGSAPRASIISYVICGDAELYGQLLAGICFSELKYLALEQAARDGVDVISISHSARGASPFFNRLEAGLLIAAREMGSLPIGSAGNGNPLTVGTPAGYPGVLAVGATETTLFAVNDLVIYDENVPEHVIRSFRGASISFGLEPRRLVLASDSGLDPAGQCLTPFPSGTWTNGEIVVCIRGTIAREAKGVNVLLGGAGGLILVNDPNGATNVYGDVHYLPAVHLDSIAGAQLIDLVTASSSRSLLASISGTQNAHDAGFVPPHTVASYSSRGNSEGAASGIMKPDMVAPGRVILPLSEAGKVEFSDWITINSRPGYDVSFIQAIGTSFASPIVAGAAARLRSLHPEWSVSALYTALVSSARVDGLIAPLDSSIPQQTEFQVRGSGFVDVGAAASASLSCEVSSAQLSASVDLWTQYLPRLNMPTIMQPFDYYSPSSDFHECMVNEPCQFQRRFTNVAGREGRWFVYPLSRAEAIIVNPERFVLGPGEEITLTVTITSTSLGSVVDTLILGDEVDTAGSQHIPVHVYFVEDFQATSFRDLSVLFHSGTVDMNGILFANYEEDDIFESSGLVGARTLTALLSQDPTKRNIFDLGDDPSLSGTIAIPFQVTLATQFFYFTTTSEATDLDIFLLDPSKVIRRSSVSFTSRERIIYAFPSVIPASDLGTWHLVMQVYDGEPDRVTVIDGKLYSASVNCVVFPGHNVGAFTLDNSQGSPVVSYALPETSSPSDEYFGLLRTSTLATIIRMRLSEEEPIVVTFNNGEPVSTEAQVVSVDVSLAPPPPLSIAIKPWVNMDDVWLVTVHLDEGLSASQVPTHTVQGFAVTVGDSRTLYFQVAWRRFGSEPGPLLSFQAVVAHQTLGTSYSLSVDREALFNAEDVTAHSASFSFTLEDVSSAYFE